MAPVALPKLIGDLQQWQMQRAGQSQSRPAVTDTVSPETTTTTSTDTSGTGRPQPAVARQPDTSRYFQQIETRIEEKDEVISLLKGQFVDKDQQITNLSTRFGNPLDRFADTQKLLGAISACSSDV